jgi:hypothetical protein
MAPLLSTVAETAGDERILLDRLLGLYEEERQVYGQVLELSRRQGRRVRTGAAMSEVRRVMEQKKACLDLVARLEMTERTAKNAWEAGRQRWSADSRATLHAAIRRVTSVIEDILACEEDNDLDMIALAQES